MGEKDYKVSLVSMRVKICPFRKGYQQILTYANISEIEDATSKTRDDHRKFHFLYAHGDKHSLEQLDKRLPQKKYGREQTNTSEAYLYWPCCEKLHQECRQWSFCHIASRVQKMRQIHPEKNFEPAENAKPPPGHFALHACIENEPGTIYSLLLALNPEFEEELKDKLIFDFNIDYLRSTMCRVRQCVKVDIYGSYNGSFYSFDGATLWANGYIGCGAKEEPQTAIERFKNVQAIVFYSLSGQHYDNLKKISVFNEYFEIVQNTNYYIIYHPKNHPSVAIGTNVHNDPREAICPIARVIKCPSEHSKSSEANGENVIKIEACLDNRAGALMKLAKLLAVRDTL